MKKFISFLLAFVFFIQSGNFIFAADENEPRANQSYYGYAYGFGVEKDEETQETIVAVGIAAHRGLYFKYFYCKEFVEFDSKIYEYADLIDSAVDLENKLGEDNLEKLSDVFFQNDNLVGSISESSVISAGVSRDFMPTITELHKKFLKAEELFIKL